MAAVNAGAVLAVRFIDSQTRVSLGGTAQIVAGGQVKILAETLDQVTTARAGKLATLAGQGSQGFATTADA